MQLIQYNIKGVLAALLNTLVIELANTLLAAKPKLSPKPTSLTLPKKYFE